ncbi:MAG: RIP metalloprotease RseP [Bacteroidales bacterium]|nr:RIP metalloprotease RseP [Bacteroidales bacterium]
MEITIRILQLILSLTILVLVHELGHYLAARLFKTRVEKFYIFFNPWFSLFKFRRGETEYGLGWLPLGGYVKIAGMIDESMDKEQMKQPPKPDEFRSKKAWQRFIIMIAGVLMNVMLAFLIYIFMLWIYGESYLPNREVKNGVMVDSLLMSTGLQNGDRIYLIENKEVEDFFQIIPTLVIEKAQSITVIRGNDTIKLPISPDILKNIIKAEKISLLMPRFPVFVAAIPDTSPNKNSGLLVNDKIIGVNHRFISFYDEFKDELHKHAGDSVILTVLRKNEVLHIPAFVNSSGKLGIIVDTDLSKFYRFEKREYSFFEAIPAGIAKTFKGISNYWKQLKLIFSKEIKGYENVGGFITIGKIFPGQWDWFSFWQLTAFLSLALAILNILPIPALDGGHVLFLLVEMITGRKPSDKVLEIAQYVGFIILIFLLLYANINDVVKLFR